MKRRERISAILSISTSQITYEQIHSLQPESDSRDKPDEFWLKSPLRTETQASVKISRKRDGGFMVYDFGLPSGSQKAVFEGILTCAQEQLGSNGGAQHLSTAETPAKPRRQTPPWKVVATFVYRDELGEVLFYSDRLERTINGTKKKKFRYCHELHGRRVCNIKGLRRVLYHLDKIVAHPTATVWICEGEKCADFLQDNFGLLATCNPMGAGTWKPGYSKMLQERDVVILKDYDTAGVSHAEDIAASLQGIARRIRIPDLSGLSIANCSGDDVYDWCMEHGHTREELLRAADVAQDYGPGTYNDIISSYQAYLSLNDKIPILVMLGAYLGIKIADAPVWLLIVGAPSGGKTAILEGLYDLSDCHLVGAMSEAGLLSGTSNRDKSKDSTGGILRELGEEGVLVCKDWGAVLSAKSDQRDGLMQAFRDIYDGLWIRNLGTDGGKTYKWEGKAGLIGATTAAIDKHHAVVTALGNRYILCRIDEGNDSTRVDHAAMALRSAVFTDRKGAVRQQVVRFINNLQMPDNLEELIPDGGEEFNLIVGLSDFASRARSHIERDRYRHEVIALPEIENSPRLAKMLASLCMGLNVAGVEPELRRAVLTRAARDSAPPIRIKILDFLYCSPDETQWFKTREVKDHINLTTRDFILRQLDDLRLLGLIHRQYVNGTDSRDGYRWAFKDQHKLFYPQKTDAIAE
jgi:hypothetical protein